ncbi:helix-turn-helix domain-containing protein [Cohaesibacter marisflavi]|uniref:helix-turn-helix domain-containing protein n=1 Tax=Cohaesibacter marisflavi TaxID=655353 RepID=UPI0038991C30
MKNTNESDPQIIAQRLNWLLDYLELSQVEFARTINASPTTLSNWLSGRSRLSLDGALSIRKTYGVSLDFLYLGRADTLPQQIAKAWASSPRVNHSSKSSEKPDA